MKKLMIGNEAVAEGLYEGGIGFISSYPGTPSTEITEFLAKRDDLHSEWAPNEKVAMEAAFGASLAGVRSACAMKHVGLNVSADPLFTMSYTGISAGLVVCVADVTDEHALGIGKVKVVVHAAVITFTGVTAYNDDGGGVALYGCLNGCRADCNLGENSLAEHYVTSALTGTECVKAVGVFAILCVVVCQAGIESESGAFKTLADVADICLVHVT